jgi:hypothetical protein
LLRDLWAFLAVLFAVPAALHGVRENRKGCEEHHDEGLIATTMTNPKLSIKVADETLHYSTGAAIEADKILS